MRSSARAIAWAGAHSCPTLLRLTLGAAESYTVSSTDEINFSYMSAPMPSSKPYVFTLLSVWLLGLCLAPVLAQKRGEQQPVRPSVPETPFSNVQRDSLLNGMQIVTLEAAEPRVRIDLVLRTGAMFDLAGKTGLAALTQETLLAVNPRLKEEMASLSGEIDWSIDSDLTSIRIAVPADNFETAVEIIGRLLVVEIIRPDAFKIAQEAQLKRIEERARTRQPAERADEAFLSALYGEHPYGHSVMGEAETVKAIKQGDVFDFMRRFYIANDVVAVVVGPITHDRVLRTFKFVFGGWVKGKLIPTTFRQPSRVTQLKLVKIEAPEAAQVELRGGLIGLKVSDQDYLIIELLARMLDARLKPITAAEGASRVEVHAPRRLLPGPFYFSATVAPERAEAFSRAATDAFAAFAANAVSAEELAAAKASLMSERARMTTGDQLRELESFGLPRNYPLNYGARLEAVTAADVHRVARQLFAANALTLVVLGPVGDRFKS